MAGDLEEMLVEVRAAIAAATGAELSGSISPDVCPSDAAHLINIRLLELLPIKIADMVKMRRGCNP